MKGLSSSRSHHHLVNCDPGSYDALGHGHHPDRKPYLINQMDMPMSHPSDHPYYTQVQSQQNQRNHTAFPSDSSVVPYGTFPRRHYSSSHQELKDRMGMEECAVVPYGVGVGVGNIVPNKGVNVRLPVNLLDQFERQPSFTRDGYHTLQYKRTALEQRNDSPGRIRHLVHSVQKLFAKSHSLEGPHSKQGSLNSSRNSPESETPPTQKHRKRSKSRERCKSAEPKHRSPTSGYWSSDDILDDRDVCHSLFHSPTGVMTMGRHPDKSQSQYFMEAFNTISEHALKTSRSNNDVVKHTCVPSHIPISMDAQLMKKSLWSSSLTVSRARQVYQKASVNLDHKALVKSEACQQERSCQFLQVPQDEWSSFSPLGGKEDDIPCRRMRSGSYVKAMAEEEDSEDSEGSPKPSPKVQAQGRRASYLKATQPSLTEMTTLKISTEHSPKLQIRSHSYLRAVSEVEVNGQIEQVCEQVYSEMESQAMDALDLPMPSCFRMRSHSYVRAMDQGCSEDEGTSLLPASPPRTTTTVRTIQSSTVSSCITTYKKTPPPVPPRTTTSKPFISITAQSSTESAQDAYIDGHGQGNRDSHPRGDMTVQSALSNSTESIDSMKALTAAIEAANAQVHGPASQHVSNSSITITTTSALAQITEDSRKEQARRAKCQLSIGIQVDGPEEEALEMEDQFKFQSIGVQVEDERGYRRLTRSNSVTAAVQADLDMPDMLDSPLDSPETDLPSSVSVSHQYSRDAATSPASTVSIQGSGNHYHACNSDDYDDVGFDPSILPPPDPWIDSLTEDPLEVVQRSVCQRDGRWFLKLLQAETDRMEGWCRQMEQDEQENDLPDDVLGKIRLAVGSAQLLMSQKFQQFRELCEENLKPNAHPRPISQDLAGFWDMLQLSIENISLKFDELHQLKANNWRPLDPPERKERRIPPPVPKKPPKGQPPLARDRSLESSEKQRLDARKRLMAAKRAASVRQNSATESADSIEIYIPEAQTRL
ncbi:disks large-associated protein 1 isoform X3 [Coregonus clupeaformis]|uniref:disks large-associated protein 1 isoform X3 n=1 Tax=Coregonus clupeaformis TaxID=59861 RepID=UPI001BE108AD|nr:disks large-associated protein 1 isoform X3 [Coregonus clupeaformis]